MSEYVKIINQGEFEITDKFLSENFSSPTHRKEWNLAISKNYDTEFFYYAYYKNDLLLGICPVHKIKEKNKYRLMSGPKEFFMPYGGWIFSGKSNFNPDLLDIKHNERIEIFSLPLLDDFNAAYDGFNMLNKFKTSIIELEQSEENIWNSFPSQRRNKIRKAIKNNVEILDFNKVGFESFYDFYLLTNGQYDLQNLSKDFFKDFINNSVNINIDILFAKFNSEILGCVILVSDKNYSIYWMGARKEEAPNNGYFDLLQWEIIKKAQARGCKYYDLCYLELERLPNIYKFKIDYSNNLFDIYNVDYKSLTYKIINKIQKFIK